jgi:hypothetical protein
MVKKKKVIQEREALIEMYKAGFLDGYKVHGKARSKKDFIEINKFYKKAFTKRFMKRIKEAIKK